MPNPYSGNLGADANKGPMIVLQQRIINAIIKGLKVSPQQAAEMARRYSDIIMKPVKQATPEDLIFARNMMRVINKNAVPFEDIGKGMLGVYPMISQALGFAQDPGAAQYNAIPGVKLAPKGSLDRAIQMRQIT